MRLLAQVLVELAASEVPVLLMGEQGVGKHLAAQQIHQASPMRGVPLLECDCRFADDATIRQVFGEDESHPGPATIYLENVEALSPTSQRTLLACLEAQNGTRRPRVITSASTELEMDVRSGRFREDLYYRLSTVCIPVPPLRYRREEILEIADQFLQKYSSEFNRPKPELTPQLVRFLQGHPWLGNLRELEEAMRTVVAVGNLKVAIAALQSSTPRSSRDRKNGTEPVSLKQVARAASQRAERELILKVLSRTHWNRKKAAEELRISYKALLYKLKEFGTVNPVFAGPGGKSE